MSILTLNGALREFTERPRNGARREFTQPPYAVVVWPLLLILPGLITLIQWTQIAAWGVRLLSYFENRQAAQPNHFPDVGAFAGDTTTLLVAGDHGSLSVGVVQEADRGTHPPSSPHASVLVIEPRHAAAATARTYRSDYYNISPDLMAMVMHDLARPHTLASGASSQVSGDGGSTTDSVAAPPVPDPYSTPYG